MSADNMLVDRYNEKYLAQKLERSLHQCHGGFVTCAGWKCLSSCQTKKKESFAVTKYKDMKCTFLFSF